MTFDTVATEGFMYKETQYINNHHLTSDKLCRSYVYYNTSHGNKNSETNSVETDNLNSELLQSLMDKIRQVEDLQGHFQEMANILTKRLDNVETYLEQLK